MVVLGGGGHLLISEVTRKGTTKKDERKRADCGKNKKPPASQLIQWFSVNGLA